MEFALQFEVTMVNCPGHPHPPAFSWNTGMVIHVLKSGPTLRDLKHIQVDGPRTVYLFFFDKQGQWGLSHEASQAKRAHSSEAFTEWISYSAHFTVNPLPLAEGWHHAAGHQNIVDNMHGLNTRALAMCESEPLVKLVGAHLPPQ